MIHQKTPSITISSVAFIMGSVTALLMVINVIMSTRVAQDGLMIDTLSKQQEELKSDIHNKEQQLYAQTSLNDLSAKAEQMGYISSTETLTISASEPIAFNH